LEKGNKDPVYLIKQINYLRSKLADVPIDSKEQQRVQYEAD